MMSIQQIVQMSDDAAKRAKAKGLRPIEIGSWAAEQRERCAMRLLNLPFIGMWVPRELELVSWSDMKLPEGWGADRLEYTGASAPYIEVDSSGWGSPTECALQFPTFVELVRANPDYRYAIVEAGQFQVIVGVYRKKGSKPAKH